MTRQERLNAAYDYLKQLGWVHRQKDVVERMNTTAPNLSKALAGDEAFLTDKFLKRFNFAYNNIFNNDWLLFDKGDMLAPARSPLPADADRAQLIELLAKKEESLAKAQDHITRLLDILAKQ